jgi:hypothetical protein
MSLSHSPKVVTDGLVLYLDAANQRSYPKSGTTWSDLKGSNNGTLTNGPTFDSASKGGIVFDGTNDQVRVGDVLPTSSDFTISASFTTSAGNSNDSCVFGNEVSPNSIWFALYWSTNYGTANNQIRLYAAGGEVLVGSDIRNTGVRGLTVTRNGNEYSLYLDGKLDGSGTRSGSLGSFLTIGYSKFETYPKHFSGQISLAFLYNRALSADEVRQNYLATRGRYK